MESDLNDAWIFRLADVLEAGRRTVVADRTDLALIDALDEAVDWLEDTRKFSRRQHKHSFESVADDLAAALESGATSQGAGLRPEIQTILEGFDVQMAMNEREVGAVVSQLAGLRRASALIRTSEGVKSAWAQMVRAAQSGKEDLPWHRNNLERVADASEYETYWSFLSMGSVLRSGGHENRMPISGRIDAAVDHLCDRGSAGDYVVWLAVENALVHSVSLPLTGVTFWDSRWIDSVLDLPVEQRNDGLPEELRLLEYNPLPNTPNLLLARVTLGTRDGAFAARDARRRVSLLLAPADRAERTELRLLGGHLTFRNGEQGGFSAFDDADVEAERYRTESSWLRDGAADLAAALAGPKSAELGQVLELMAWDLEHQSDDPLATVLLSVRTIETVAQTLLGGKSWTQLVDSYRTATAVTWIQSELFESCYSSLHRSRLEIGAGLLDEARQLKLDNFKHSNGGFSFSHRRLASILPEMSNFWPDRPDRREDLVALQRCWDRPAIFSERLGRHEQILERKARRLRRLRNAAQHGGPIPDASLRSVHEFVATVRDRALLDLVIGLQAGKSCLEILDERLKLSEELHDALRSGTAPVDALFGAAG